MLGIAVSISFFEPFCMQLVALQGGCICTSRCGEAQRTQQAPRHVPNAPVTLNPVDLPAVRRCYRLSERNVDIRRGPSGVETAEAAEPVLTWCCVGAAEQLLRG